MSSAHLTGRRRASASGAILTDGNESSRLVRVIGVDVLKMSQFIRNDKSLVFYPSSPEGLRISFERSSVADLNVRLPAAGTGRVAEDPN